MKPTTNKQTDSYRTSCPQIGSALVFARRSGFSLAVAASMIGLASLHPHATAATVIDTTGGPLSPVQPFGVPNTATYGQTITAPAPDNVLNSFSFRMDLPSSTTFQTYVFAWDGSKATGSALFTSAVTATLGAGVQEMTFATGGTPLISGSSYVLFASVSQVPGSSGTGTWQMNFDTDTYLGGHFVFLNNGPDASLWTTSDWDNFGGFDLAFKATFSESTSAIPEPSSALGIIGLLAGGMIIRRRR